VRSVDLVAWGGLAVGGRGVAVCISGDCIVGQTIIHFIEAEVISQAIQSQLAAMLPNMIHETLAKKNFEGTASSS